jgi:hypothetical protein
VSRAGRLIPGERAGSYQRVRVADIGPVATEHRPSTSPVRRLPSLSRPRHRRECPLRRGHSPKGIFSMLRGAPGCFAVPLAPKLCSTYNTNNTRDDPAPLDHTPNPDIATTKPETEKQGKQKGTGTCKELAEFIRYYASTQSRARTPEERSVVTWRTASSSPERSRHRCTRSSPKFSLRWLAA